MTDQQPDRAEQAFRDALAAHAEDAQFQPLDLPTLPRSGRRTWTRPLQVAAAILLVAVVGSVAVRLVPSGSESTAGVPAPAAASAPDVGDSARPEVAAPASKLRPGWRWESFANLRVQVPDSWGYGLAPASDWCVPGGAKQSEPFVDLGRGYRPIREIFCGGRPSSSRLQMYLGFAWPDDTKLGYTLPDGWRLAEVAFKQASVRIVYPIDQAALAEQIRATVEVDSLDPNGCPAEHRVQQPRYLEPTSTRGLGVIDSVTSLAVCQYAVGAPVASGLLASTTLAGSEAAAVLADLKAAPTGGGPDDPGSCTPHTPDGKALVLRLTNGARLDEVYVYYAGCVHNGSFDGVTARALTDTCRTLVRPPLSADAGQLALGRCNAAAAVSDPNDPTSGPPSTP